MAEPIPFTLALLMILGIIVILSLAELAIFYPVSTRIPDRFFRIAAPVFAILLGISSLMHYDEESVFATSALVAAPVAAFITPSILPGFAGQKSGIRRIVACYLVVSLFAAGFALYVVLSGSSMVPWISSLPPVSKVGVFAVALVVDLLLATGVYKGMERAGILEKGEAGRL